MNLWKESHLCYIVWAATEQTESVGQVSSALVSVAPRVACAHVLWLRILGPEPPSQAHIAYPRSGPAGDESYGVINSFPTMPYCSTWWLIWRVNLWCACAEFALAGVRRIPHRPCRVSEACMQPPRIRPFSTLPSLPSAPAKCRLLISIPLIRVLFFNDSCYCYSALTYLVILNATFDLVIN